MKSPAWSSPLRGIALALLLGAPLLCTRSAESADIAKLVSDPGFWTLKGTEVVAKFPAKMLGFFPKNQSTLAQTTQPALTASFGNLTMYSMSLDLASNAVLRVSGSLLNPSSRETVTNENAENKIETVLKELDTWAGRKNTPLSGASRGKGFKLRSHVWSKDGVGVVFTYAMKENKATQRGQKDIDQLIGATLDFLPVRPGAVDARALADRDRVLGAGRPVAPMKTKEGDLLVANIRPGLLIPPSASPGAIAVERAMRTVGVELETFDLPQFNSAGDGPVNTARNLAFPLKYRFVDEFKADEGSFDKLRRDYNQLAKKSGAPIVDDALRLNMAGQLNLMDPETLRQARGTKTNEIAGFRRAVQKYVSKGIPVLWVMCDGMIGDNPGAKRQITVMLITGMNPAKDEVLYLNPSDPSGATHRMTFPDGWCVTLSVGAIIR
jgi:hypothetical protein